LGDVVAQLARQRTQLSRVRIRLPHSHLNGASDCVSYKNKISASEALLNKKNYLGTYEERNGDFSSFWTDGTSRQDFLPFFNQKFIDLPF
jgi:hypothetical protein